MSDETGNPGSQLGTKLRGSTNSEAMHVIRVPSPPRRGRTRAAIPPRLSVPLCADSEGAAAKRAGERAI
eukprot:15433992-Alexandrium_andersonii.AAC.1